MPNHHFAHSTLNPQPTITHPVSSRLSRAEREANGSRHDSLWHMTLQNDRKHGADCKAATAAFPIRKHFEIEMKSSAAQ